MAKKSMSVVEKMLTTDKLHDIAVEYGMHVVSWGEKTRLIFNVTREQCEEVSFVVGDDIYIGFYPDDDEGQEKLFASFFHEVGHRLDEHETSTEGPDNRVTPELIAWMIGLREAAKHNVTFSAGTLDWALQQALTYRNYK